MNKILDGLYGVVCLIDDILINATSKAEHDRNLEAALRCIQSAGMTLNKDKCKFGKETTKLLGHVINAEAVLPDPQKTAAVRIINEPSIVSEL